MIRPQTLGFHTPPRYTYDPITFNTRVDLYPAYMYPISSWFDNVTVDVYKQVRDQVRTPLQFLRTISFQIWQMPLFTKTE